VVVGSIELSPVPDAVGLFAEYGDVYPDIPAEAWEPYRQLYPELFAGEMWRVPCKCFLVRSEGVTILVDTGVGPSGLGEWRAELEGELPEALARLGVRPDDVDMVFLTHLHIDHVGWNTDRDGKVFFPRARYIVHPDSLAFARRQGDRAHVQRCILTLEDRVETIGGAVELATGVAAFLSPGHYPGHMGLRLHSEGTSAMLLADAAVHPAFLHEPGWVYLYDEDPGVCVTTRRALLPELVDRDVIVACGHYPGSGIGRVVTREGRVVWEEAR